MRLPLFLLALLMQAQPLAAQAPRQGVACLLASSATRLNVREATGNNDGPAVELVQRLAGARVGIDPWCGCERNYWNILCGRPRPAWPAAAANWSKPADPRTFYMRGVRGSVDSLKVGDTVTFYYTNLGRVGHVGMVVAKGRPLRAGRAPRFLTIRAGNTGSGGGRDGAGVHDSPYAPASIYAGSNW